MSIFFFVCFFSILYCYEIVREPIIFAGGLGGQALEAKLEDATEPHYWCYSNNDWYRIWMNPEEEVPGLSLDCFFNNFEAHFDREKKEYQNSQGVSIRPADFGGLGSIEYIATNILYRDLSNYLHDWIEYFAQFGYTDGVNFRSAPYDWRFGPREWEKNTEWGFPALQKLVEETYTLNGNQKVHLMGHSLGSPYLGYFLSSFPTQEWKDKYISSFISLGGPFDGAFSSTFLNIIGFNFFQLFSPTQQWIDILKQIGGTQWMTPQFQLLDHKFLFTDDRPEGYSMNEYQELMRDADSDVSYDIYEWERSALKNQPPGVSTYCLYGTGLPTMSSGHIPDLTNPLGEGVYTSELFWGDGTVHDESLRICDGFAEGQAQPVTVIRYPYMHHTPMVHNQTVWDDVLSIVTKNVTIAKNETNNDDDDDDDDDDNNNDNPTPPPLHNAKKPKMSAILIVIAIVCATACCVCTSGVLAFAAVFFGWKYGWFRKARAWMKEKFLDYDLDLDEWEYRRNPNKNKKSVDDRFLWEDSDGEEEEEKPGKEEEMIEVKLIENNDSQMVVEDDLKINE